MIRINRALGVIFTSLGFLAWSAGTLAGTVPITVEEPSGVRRSGWPVTSGIPLGEGELSDPSASALFTRDGREVPLQTEVLARWPDDSIRWLLLDFQVDLAAGQKRSFTLHYGAGVKRSRVNDPVLLRRTGPFKATVQTGPVRLKVFPWPFWPSIYVALDMDDDGEFGYEEDIAVLADWAQMDPDSYRQLLWPKLVQQPVQPLGEPDEIVIEQSGPLRTCVRVSGRHLLEGNKSLRCVMRIHAYRGRPFVRVCHTFINDQHDVLMAKVPHIKLASCLASNVSGAKHCTTNLKDR